jgi:hypothetical protein
MAFARIAGSQCHSQINKLRIAPPFALLDTLGLVHFIAWPSCPTGYVSLVTVQSHFVSHRPRSPLPVGNTHTVFSATLRMRDIGKGTWALKIIVSSSMSERAFEVHCKYDCWQSMKEATIQTHIN